MGVINMLLKIFSNGRGTTGTVLIIQVLHMKNIGHTCCLNLEEYAPALIMEGCAYTIM